MASNVVFNGVTYSIPAVGDSGWGADLSAYFISIASNALQKSGGNFTLTSEVNFGATYGVRAPYFRSSGTNPAVAGIVRLANTEPIAWRNAANSADLSLFADASGALVFNGTSLTVGGDPVQTEITVSDTATIDLTIASNDISGIVKPASIDNSHIAVAAAIAYSKLNLAGAIVNADISASAAIAYSKLTLTGSIVNADIGAAAAIALSKLAAITVSRALQSNASTGAIEVSSVTNTELGYLSGVTSAIQTQINTKSTNPMTTANDLIVGGASGTPTRLATSNLSVLGTNGSGVQGWLSGAVANRILRTDGTTISFSSVGLSTDVAGTLPIANGGTNNNSLGVTAGGVVYGDGTRLQTTSAGSSNQYLKSNAGSAPSWSTFTKPTIQRFTATSGTYTLPAGCQYIVVEVVGGGGAGGSSGTASFGAASGGNDTTFGASLNAKAGSGGGQSSGGSGVANTASEGTILVNITGGQGQGAQYNNANGQYLHGGMGGANGYGTPGSGGAYGAAGSAGTFGGGGGGAGGTSAGVSGFYTGSGGGAGGYIKTLITSPSPTYSYVAGGSVSGATAGTSGSAGGGGGAGVIVVTEYYH